MLPLKTCISGLSYSILPATSNICAAFAHTNKRFLKGARHEKTSLPACGAGAAGTTAARGGCAAALADPRAVAVIEEYVPGFVEEKADLLGPVLGMKINMLLKFPQAGFKKEDVADICAKLDALDA